MNRKLIAFAAALAATTGSVSAVAAAGPATVKQRVAIEVERGSSPEPFTLTPLSSGTVAADHGLAAFCCWTNRHVVRAGETLDLNDPQMTLTGKQGTIVIRNRIVWMDIPNGAAIYTGTWKVVRGTGAYAGLGGSGTAAGLMLANGNVDARFAGSLTRKR
jgi:hypothetical protein